MIDGVANFPASGFAVIPDVVSSARCDSVAADPALAASEAPGTRTLLSAPWCAALVEVIRPAHISASPGGAREVGRNRLCGAKGRRSANATAFVARFFKSPRKHAATGSTFRVWHAAAAAWIDLAHSRLTNGSSDREVSSSVSQGGDR
jgi:hypothetical protein